MTIAITGTTGTIGGGVAARLSEAGMKTRLIGRDPSRLPTLNKAHHGPAASYGDTAAMTNALEGAEKLFFVSGRESATRLEEHKSVVDAAKAAGVQHIVYLSFLNAAEDAVFTLGLDHFHTEQYIKASGIAFTFLRDSMYQHFMPLFVDEYDTIRGPAGDGAVSIVSHDDIINSAVEVLTGRDHEGRTYDMTGPVALTFHDIVGALSDAIGRPISYVAETEGEALASRAHYGAPEFEVRGWISSYLSIAAGEMATVSDDILRLTGAVPQTFDEFLRAHPECLAPLKR